MKPRIPFASEPCVDDSPECVVATAFTYLDELISHDAGSVRLTDDVTRTHNGHPGGVSGADQLRAVILLEPVAAHYNFRWVIDGNDGLHRNDVWQSSDGVTWAQASVSAAFSARDATTALVYNNMMLVGLKENFVCFAIIKATDSQINYSFKLKIAANL